MIKICSVSGINFEVSDKDLEFYKKLGVPEPTLCPRERVRRRMAVRNERNLYRRKSSFSGDNIISAYHADSACPVYAKDEWLSDKWDPMTYGISIDFNKPFFGQFHELQKSVPRPALAVFANAENADFCNYVGDVKNSYLCFGSIFIEDCMYGNPYYSKSCVDCFLIRKSEFCYECVDGENLYHCAYLQDCYECSETYFSYDLKGCRNCFGCSALRKKQYCVFNQQYSKVDYDKFMAGFSFCDKARVIETEKKLEELKLKSPRQAMMVLNSENVTGNYIFNCKNCFNCFSISRNEDCNYNIQTVDNKDCYDMNYTEENELCYEYLGNYRNHTALFCAFPYGCHDIWYCDYVTNCKHCFGCVAIKNKEYCILNKQYSKDEYFELVGRLTAMMKGTPATAGRAHGASAQDERQSRVASPSDSELINKEFGEFFPVNISPFAYNESVAYDYFPLSKEEALKRGYRWRDEDKSEFKPTSYVPPADIKDVPDSIINEVLSCEASGRNYKITPAELKFYRLMKLPVPRKHFIERHMARLAKRLPYELFDRKCGKCGMKIKTAYSPNRQEAVYCEKCYLETVY